MKIDIVISAETATGLLEALKRARDHISDLQVARYTAEATIEVSDTLDAGDLIAHLNSLGLIGIAITGEREVGAA